MAGGLTQSSSGSGVFFQGDGQSQILVNSHLNATRNSPNSGRPNMCMISGETNNPVLNNISNSGPSVGASSLVTDANSDFSGGPQLQRNASFNTDSYMRLPASPMSFSSNNITISGSSVVDGSTVAQKSSQQDLGVQQQGASSATSLPTPQTNQASFPLGSRIPGSFIQDPYYISQVQKKPRLDMKQEDILQQQVFQQLFQRQDSIQFQGQNPQLQLLLQQQRLRQQQQLLQSMPPLQRIPMQQQQQQQLQLRHQLQQQGMQQQISGVKRSYDSGICTRRLMQYLYHQRQRPPDNSIVYWRKFVAEYFSPRAKKRWCLSLYDNVGQQRLGAIPQAAADAWHCDICGSNSGRGFEATFEVLPRLNEIKFGSGIIDELLYLDLPQECRFASGIMMLEYGKAVQETVYEQLRVVREGHLRIKFSQDLKILSWEFCARRHEELLPRRLVAPQVNQLLQVAQKCQSTISESGSDGVSQQDLQANSKMVLTAGRQLAKSLELQFLNDLGFSKRYVRCLQISEVVNSMKDLFDFCGDHKFGPMDALKSYPRNTNASKLQMQQKMHEIEQLATAQGLPNDRSTLNKLLALHSGINVPMSNAANQMAGHGVPSGSGPTPFANCQSMRMRQSSVPTNPNKTNQSPSSSTLSAGGFSSPRLPPQHQMQMRSLSASQQQDPNRNQALQQQMIQQMYQEMSNNGQQQSIPGQERNIVNMGRSSIGFEQNGQNGIPGTPTASNVSGTSGHGQSLSRNNSFNAASNNDTSSAADSKSGFNQCQNLASHEFTGTEFFNSDLDDNLGYTWKT